MAHLASQDFTYRHDFKIRWISINLADYKSDSMKSELLDQVDFFTKSGGFHEIQWIWGGFHEIFSLKSGGFHENFM